MKHIEILRLRTEMRFFYHSALWMALSLGVCLAASPASAHYRASNEAEGTEVEAGRANLMTLDEELLVGQRLAYLYAQLHPTLKDAATQTRLNRVAARLCAATGAPDLRITIIKSARPDALSFPPRLVFITTALLELTRTDDELAAVIAHEAAHVTSHHLSRLIALTLTLPSSEREQFPTRAAIITGRAAQFMFPPALDEERLRCEIEADRLAVRWLERAGYRARALTTLLDNITARLLPRQQRERAALRKRLSKLT